MRIRRGLRCRGGGRGPGGGLRLLGCCCGCSVVGHALAQQAKDRDVNACAACKNSFVPLIDAITN